MTSMNGIGGAESDQPLIFEALRHSPRPRRPQKLLLFQQHPHYCLDGIGISPVLQSRDGHARVASPGPILPIARTMANGKLASLVLFGPVGT